MVGSALNHYYVDPASGDDTLGDGLSEPSAWQTIDKALQTMTNGDDQLNVKNSATVSINAAFDFASYGASSFDRPFILRGYSSAINDGGKVVIDMQGNSTTIAEQILATSFIDCDFRNTGSATIVNMGTYSAAIRCNFSGTTGIGLGTTGGRGPRVFDCYFTDCDVGVEARNDSTVMGCTFIQGATTAFSYCVNQYGAANVQRNLMIINGSSGGIDMDGSIYGGQTGFNSIYSPSGSGRGIWLANAASIGTNIYGNIVSGFSDGGVCFHLTDIGGRFMHQFEGNAAYTSGTGNAYNASFPLDSWVTAGTAAATDNETLTDEPFALFGAASYANRLAYLAPNDVGNVHLSTLLHSHKGAVCPSGGGGFTRHPLASFHPLS